MVAVCVCVTTLDTPVLGQGHVKNAQVCSMSRTSPPGHLSSLETPNQFYLPFSRRPCITRRSKSDQLNLLCRVWI